MAEMKAWTEQRITHMGGVTKISPAKEEKKICLVKIQGNCFTEQALKTNTSTVKVLVSCSDTGCPRKNAR